MANNISHDRLDDGGADWSALASRVGALAAEETVTDLDVARLRRRVRTVTAPASTWSHRMSRFAAVAAAGLVGALGMYTALDGAPRATRVANGAISMEVRADGGVAIAFADGKSVHRVTKCDGPQPDAADSTAIAHGQTFVDRDGSARPGEVTFYRID